jgi:hypothetical protein
MARSLAESRSEIRLMRTLLPRTARWRGAHELGLDEAVVADHLEGDRQVCRRQPGPAVGVMRDKLQLARLPSNPFTEPGLTLSSSASWDVLTTTSAVAARQPVERLEVILLRARLLELPDDDRISRPD